MALFRPELWVQSGFPSTYSGTFVVKAYITSDAGASTQVLISRNWSSANEGIVLYWDNSADVMTVAWFTGGGATVDFTDFASRPAIGVPFICFLRNTASAVEAGWAYLTNPTDWVLASTATAIPSVGTDNAMNLTSNANGALGVYEGWFGWSDQKTNAEISLEVYDTAINRTNLIFEHSLNNGDVTSPWPDTSGQGNDATQQGGLAPTDTPNFLPAISGAKIQIGVRTPQLLSTQRKRQQSLLWNQEPQNWGLTKLEVPKWFAPELTVVTSSFPTGTVNKTNANDTLSAAGTTTIVGTLAKTNVNDTSAISGTTTVVGTLAKTNANDTSAVSGTTTVLGTLAVTNANDTLSASGTTTIIGTVAVTNANDTLAASGTVGGAVSGTLAVTNTNDTLSSSGTTTVLGTVAKTNVNDSSSAQGTTTILGTLAVTNVNDTLAASGSVGNAVTGTLAVTNANDTLSATAFTTIVATLSKTNVNDTSSISGTTTILGTLSKTNSNDTLSASGTSGTPAAGIATKLPLTGAGG